MLTLSKRDWVNLMISPSKSYSVIQCTVIYLLNSTNYPLNDNNNNNNYYYYYYHYYCGLVDTCNVTMQVQSKENRSVWLFCDICSFYLLWIVALYVWSNLVFRALERAWKQGDSRQWETYEDKTSYYLK